MSAYFLTKKVKQKNNQSYPFSFENFEIRTHSCYDFLSRINICKFLCGILMIEMLILSSIKALILKNKTYLLKSQESN